MLVAQAHRQIITASDKSRMMEILPPAQVNPMTDRFIQGHEGSGILVNPEGIEMLATAKNIPAAGWYVAIELPTAEAFAPVQAMQRRMLWATIGLTLLIGALTWLVLRRQLSPLLSAVNSLASIEASNPPMTPLPVRRMDEVGQLITGFNHLLEILAEREEAYKAAESRLVIITNRVPGVIYEYRYKPGEGASFSFVSDGAPCARSGHHPDRYR